MIVIDIIILVILLFFMFSGIRSGFIRQILGIVGIIAAFVGAFYMAHHMSAFFEDTLELSYSLALVVSAIILFVGILIAFYFIGVVLQKLVKIASLGSFDRLGGGLFGVLKGTLLVSLLLVLTLNLPFPSNFKKELRKDPLVAAIHPVLPGLFDLFFSHSPSRLSFDKVLRTDEVKALGEARDKAKEAEKGIKKTKEKLKKAAQELDD
jgi:membrane protein required for colicin V production